jgi:hypothetical protein
MGGTKKCTNEGGHICKIAGAAYRLGRAAGLDEAVEVAHAKAAIGGVTGTLRFIDWTEVDAEIERRKGPDND